jgi:hypothetical protein
MSHHSDPYYRSRMRIESRYVHAENILQAERLFKRDQEKVRVLYSLNRISECSLLNEIADMIQKEVSVDNVPEEMNSWSPELEFGDDFLEEIIDKVREIEEGY